MVATLTSHLVDFGSCLVAGTAVAVAVAPADFNVTVSRNVQVPDGSTLRAVPHGNSAPFIFLLICRQHFVFGNCSEKS